jgi:hypothetical protein
MKWLIVVDTVVTVLVVVLYVHVVVMVVAVFQDYVGVRANVDTGYNRVTLCY